MSDDKKLHIDDDWKAQAQKEKETLAQELDKQNPGDEGPMPKPEIRGLINMLAMQAAVGLGGMRDPATGQQIPPSPDLAKLYIELLEVIDEKTQGNLNEEEKHHLDTTLYQLRMAFVQVMSGGGEPPATK